MMQPRPKLIDTAKLAEQLARYERLAARWEGKDQSHLEPCAPCPSNQGCLDPEAQYMLDSGYATPFFCAWRPGVWCVAWNRALAAAGLPEGGK